MSEQAITNPFRMELEKIRLGLDRLDLWARQMEQAYFNVRQDRKPTAYEVVSAVCEEWDVFDAEQLKQHSNMQRCVEPRQVAMYLLRLKLGMSLPALGDFFGAFHHTTVLHGINKVENRMKTDEEFKQRVERVAVKLSCGG